jgi:hypothetical protein
VIETTVMADDPPARSSSKDQASIGEVLDYVKTYAKQETLGPLKGAGRWVIFGAAGAICLGIGLSIALLGLLRLLQTEWSWVATDHYSWIPYVSVFVACLILLALSIMRINKTFLDKEQQ